MATTIFLVNPQNFFQNLKSLRFDGIDERLDCGTISALTSATSFSVSAWVRFNDGTALESITGRNTSTTNRILCMANVSANTIRFSVTNGASLYTDYNATLSTGTWYHIVWVYDGTLSGSARQAVYLDGSACSINTATGTPPASTNASGSNWYVGNVGGTNYGQVDVDEERIYNYALTPSQVTSIYNSGTPKQDNLTTPAIHWWRMGDGNDTITTIYDVGSSASNNGSPQNMESGDIISDVP